MSKILTTKNLSLEMLTALKERISEGHTYGFIADSQTTSSDDINIIRPSDFQERIQILRSMLYGKRILSDNTEILARRIDWTENTVFEMYDDKNVELRDSNFYVVVQDTDNANVFKCLFNNNGGLSTIVPEIPTEKDENIYHDTDGYIWKWICKLNSTQIRDFETDEYIPVSSRSDQLSRDQLKPGAIEVIKIENPGAGYQNYYEFIVGDIDVEVIPGSGDNPIMTIRVPPSVEIENTDNPAEIKRLTATTGGKFDGCLVYISNILGGQYSFVQSSSIENSVMKITLQDSISITDGSKVIIAPAVIVSGNGLEDNTRPAIGYGVVDIFGDRSIKEIVMLENGRDYSYATARVTTGDIPPRIEASVRPIISPRDGHGSHIEEELNCRALGIITEFDSNENELSFSEYDFAQYGIIQDPEFTNVSIRVSPYNNSISNFVRGEEIVHFTISPKFDGMVSFSGNTITANVVADGLNYSTFFKPGDYIYLEEQRTNTIVYHFDKVISVGERTITLENNSTVLSVNQEVISLFKANIVTRGNVASLDSTNGDVFYAGGIRDKLLRGERIIGLLSRTIGVVEDVNINDKLTVQNPIHQFDVFVQAIRCIGRYSASDPFVNREDVFAYKNGSEKTGSAQVVTSIDRGNDSFDVYLTNVEGEIFSGTGTLRTISGDKTFEIENKYNGELDVTSGSILYLQNDVPVTRTGISKENIRVILEL